MKIISNTFYRFCLYLTAIFCCNIFVLSLLTLENKDKIISELNQNIIFVLTIVLFSIFLIALFVFIYHKLPSGPKINHIMSISLFTLMLILQILFLLFVSHPMLTADAATVQSQALAMLNTQHGQLDLNIPYFQDYANNHFFVILLYYFYSLLKLFGITNIWLPTIILNVLCLDLGIFISYLSVKKIKSHTLANYFLVLCIFCPTTYVWLTYAYTNIFSIPFVMGVLYLFLCIRESTFEKKTVIYCVLLGICMVLGYLIRPTTILPIIAVILFYIIKYFKKKRSALIKGSIILMACVLTFLSYKAIQSKHIAGDYAQKSFPITHWIMMGLKGDGGFNPKDRQYTQSFTTKKAKKDANLKVIKERLVSMGGVGYLGLVERKLERVWAWGEDDAFNKARYAKDYPPLYEYVLGSQSFWFKMYMQAFRAITFFFILFSIFRQIRKKECQDIFLYTLTLLGAILFFILWEANVKYNICFLYLCLILMSDGVQTVSEKAYLWQHKHTALKPYFVKSCFVISICSLLLGSVFSCTVFAREDRVCTRQVYYPGVHDAYSIENINKSPQVLEQTFQVGQSLRKNKWNHIRLQFQTKQPQRSNEKEYRIEIFSNPDRKLLYSTQIGMNDLEKNASYCIQYTPKLNDKVENYSIRLTHIGESYDFQTYVMKYSNLDNYPYGTLYMDGEETENDLCFQLFFEKE